MAKQGIFPYVRDGVFDATAVSHTWGDGNSVPSSEGPSGKVGVIKVTVDSTNFIKFKGEYPGDPGDCVIVTNASSNVVNIIISPEPYDDSSQDAMVLSIGRTVCVMYHPELGWIFFGDTTTAE